MISYSNPPFEITQRAPIQRYGDFYKLMIVRIYEGSKCDNPRVYDAVHHSFETRSTRAHHKKCTLFTPKTYAQTQLENTEETFFKLAVGLKYADESAQTIIPVYFSELEVLSSKVSKTKLSQTQALSSADLLQRPPNNFNPQLMNLNFPLQSSMNPFINPHYNPFHFYSTQQSPFAFQGQISNSFFPNSPLLHIQGQQLLQCPSPQVQAENQNQYNSQVLPPQERIEEEKEVEEVEGPQIMTTSPLEKTIVDLSETQRMMQNQLAGMMNFISNLSTKGKKAKKKEVIEEEEEQVQPRRQKCRGKKKKT